LCAYICVDVCMYVCMYMHHTNMYMHHTNMYMHMDWQAPSGLTDGGYKKRGSLAVSKIDAAGFYYLNIEGEPGHALKCILQVTNP